MNEFCPQIYEFCTPSCKVMNHSSTIMCHQFATIVIFFCIIWIWILHNFAHLPVKNIWVIWEKYFPPFATDLKIFTFHKNQRWLQNFAHIFTSFTQLLVKSDSRKIIWPLFKQLYHFSYRKKLRVIQVKYCILHLPQI